VTTAKPAAARKKCVQCAGNPLLQRCCTACGGTGLGVKAAKVKKAVPPLAEPAFSLELPPKPGPFSDPLSALRSVWGFPRFRPGQRETIDALMAGEDVIAISPTGSGKSLNFQLPSVLRVDRPVLVMSPLIALMRDQVAQALERGIPALAITSQYTPAQIAVAMREMPNASIIYAAPERFDNSMFQTMLSARPPWLVACDEMHVAGNEAGLSYRPAYRFARSLLDMRSTGGQKVQWLAVTASATEEVVQDIRDTFRMQGARLFRFSCDRPNLSYRVRACEGGSKIIAVRNLLDKHLAAGGAGIVYTLRRQDAEDIADYLRRQGREARHYHAGMTGKGQRREVEELFFGKKLDVVVATCAFGMGVDRSDVRVVVMHGLPKSIEDFYQMAGRGGRDGKPSVAVALYDSGKDYRTRKWLITSGKDLTQNRYSERYGFTEDKFEQSKERQLGLLRQLDEFLRSRRCRAQLLRQYFSEEAGKPCGNCDNCELFSR
jgi:ATP-dependent DNA helicase RecQ